MSDAPTAHTRRDPRHARHQLPGAAAGREEASSTTCRPGEVLLLYSDCPGTQDDLFAWSRYTDNRIARTERRPDGSHAYYIQRGRAQHPAPSAVLDLRGVVCPGPIVEAKKLLGSMRSGETLKLVSNCPGIADDVAGWVKATGLPRCSTPTRRPRRVRVLHQPSVTP